MLRVITQRLLSIIPVLLGVSMLVFSMLHLVPGDPVLAMLGEGGGVTTEDLERMRAGLGLNDPLPVQYGRFVLNALQGDLGDSIRTKKPVVDEIMRQLPSTLQLALASSLVALTMGLVFGTIAAYRHNTWTDTITMLLSMLGVSMPTFWLGLILLLVFASQLRWVPITGQGGLVRLILPTLTLGLILAAPLARLTRSALLDVLSQDYVRTARAKGLSEPGVVLVHALRNALIPVITLTGLQFGTLLANAVVVESVFARQGIGLLMVTSIQNRDFPMVQGIVLLMGTSFVAINLVVDLINSWLDPRARLA